MIKLWKPEDHLRDEIQNIKGVADYFRKAEKVDVMFCKFAASDIDRHIEEIKEIFADMTKQLTAQTNKPPAPQRINLIVKGDIGEAARGPWPFQNVKLDMSKAREIRRRYYAGEDSQAALAKEYGVCELTMNRIIRNHMWKEAAI